MAEKIYNTLLNSPWISSDQYKTLYQQSNNNRDAFWLEQTEILDWIQKPSIASNSTFHKPVSIEWFADGVLNVSINCIDRHLPEHANTTAIIWQGDAVDDVKHITYQELHDQVCRFANVLKSRGVKKGDRVTIYMPMIPETAYAMLACSRIGAVHSVVFAGFSSESLQSRLEDCGSSVIITADEGVRGGKSVPLKANVDQTLLHCPFVTTVIVLKRTNASVNMTSGRDIWWHEAAEGQSTSCTPEPMNAEDPFFILYTSGSTGKPKGVLHTTGGYMVYTAMTHKYIFDYKPGDIYWCTADIGWVTGHSYLLYGPLCNAATTLMFEGVPHYPDFGRVWQIVDQHNVNILYTAPTLIRALMREGDDYVKQHKRTSLKLLGSVGEPINPEAWEWYYHVVGDSRCPIVDTWWQTETGGILITPLPGATPQKPGSATTPFFGIEPCIVDQNGLELEGEADGILCIKHSWPGQMRTLYGDHERFENTYFLNYPGLYFSGDGARRDADGYYWISGRVDDVLNISGHRLGTAEIESALVTHAAVAEAAVVGFPHDIKGQGIFAFVIINSNAVESAELVQEMRTLVREIIGAIATPDHILIVDGLPKTRSGKIMRRILRKIAAGEFDALGDISTLADPAIVDHIIKKKGG